MNTRVYQFEFTPLVDITEAEATLQLAIIAAEGLFGEAQVRMTVSYHAVPAHRVIHVDGGSESGDAVVRIFTSLLTCEFGPDEFTVRRVASPICECMEVAA